MSKNVQLLVVFLANQSIFKCGTIQISSLKLCTSDDSIGELGLAEVGICEVNPV